MKQENKELIICKDLCARLVYDVIGLIHNVNGDDYTRIIVGDDISLVLRHFITIKPYLRPMSSMTEEEVIEFINLADNVIKFANRHYAALSLQQIDWLNAHHFDYRELIPKGLAIEAPEGMYKN